MIAKSLQILQELQYQNGLFAAAKQEKTGYEKAWIRDNVYAVLGFEAVKDYKTAVKTLRALLDIILKHEYKIDWMIKQPEPKHRHRYMHARYNPETREEIREEQHRCRR